MGTGSHRAMEENGSAFVISSTLVRGILTAIYWVAPPVYPCDLFAYFDAACRWSLGQLAARQRSVAAHR